MYNPERALCVSHRGDTELDIERLKHLKPSATSADLVAGCRWEPN